MVAGPESEAGPPSVETAKPGENVAEEKQKTSESDPEDEGTKNKDSEK